VIRGLLMAAMRGLSIDIGATKATAEKAKLTKRVYPHLLRHSVATTLLERGMPIEQIQKFLGHSKLETTQIYAESTTEMLKESYRRALTQ